MLEPGDLTNPAELLVRWFAEYPALAGGAALLLLVAAAGCADWLAKRKLVGLIRRMASRSRSTWDDALAEHQVFRRLAHIVPALVIYLGIPLIPQLPAGLIQVTRNVAIAYMALMIVLGIGAGLSAANDIYERYPVARHRPIKGYLQVAKIIIYGLGGILVLATLMERSPLLLISGLGAMTAVLMLVFKDTILSLVASVQLSSNEMVRVGDWIEMPQYGADGDVVDIALHTVKVQNWDKTITTIPTHKLIADSFRNWRGMSESGGRRIKRAVNIDLNSIRFLTEAEIERFTQFVLLRDYIRTKQQRLADYNTRIGANQDASVNLRRLTNIGTFRAYIVNYLRNHPDLSQTMTLLVRQLPPGAEGLPLEIYVFTNDTAWVAYEGIQSDIFDHILAITPEFGLRLFQNPTGLDLRSLGRIDRPFVSV